MHREISLAIRTLRKNPGFTAVASITLAIGIGANSAVFSLIEALLLRSLPVERPAELAVLGPGALGTISMSDRPQSEVFSFAQFQALRDRSNGVVTGVAATPTVDNRVYWGEPAASGSDLQRASCVLVSGSYFPLLGVRPVRGRLLGPEDDGAPGANPVAVVSHAFWQGGLGGAPDVVGSTIRIHDLPYAIVGVAEPSFRGHVVEFAPEIWVPLSMQPQVTRSPSRLQRGIPFETFWLNVLVRIRTGASLPEAEEAINLWLRQIFLEHAGDGISEKDREYIERLRVALTPIKNGLSRLRGVARRPLLLLWAATAIVLLIACANLGGLLLVRSAARRREFAVRQALGGTVTDLMRPLLAESAVLALMGTALGCATAYWLVPVMHDWLGEIRGAEALDVHLAWTELLFAAAVGALTVFLFGLAPATAAARRAAWSSRQSARLFTTAEKRDARTRSVLVAGQCALAIVLLASAGLFLRSLSELRASDLGLDAEHVVGIRLDPRGAGFAPESQPSMRRRILARVAAIPEVESAAFTGTLPLQGNHGRSTVSVSGYEAGEDEDMSVIHVSASPDYFRTLGITLIEGRVPGREERDAIVVNRAFAERFFPGGSAVGGVVDNKRPIAGVVTNVRQVILREAPPPLVYRPTAGYEDFVRTLAVRSSLPPETIAETVREAVREAVPGMPVDRQFTTVDLHLERAVAVERMLSRLVGSFGGVAVLLAGIGLFGVCSHAVRSRTHEIGVRMALGASAGQVRSMVLRWVTFVLGAGAVAGVAGAAGAGQIVEGLLHGVNPLDWRVTGGAVAALVASGYVASTVPVVRAGRTRPAEALRHE